MWSVALTTVEGIFWRKNGSESVCVCVCVNFSHIHHEACKRFAKINIKLNKATLTSSGGAAGTRIVGNDYFFQEQLLSKTSFILTLVYKAVWCSIHCNK